MRYHWIRDQVKQQKFRVTWKRGKLNLADFFTKAHPVHHHLAMRKIYLATTDAKIREGEHGTIDSSEGVLIHE